MKILKALLGEFSLLKGQSPQSYFLLRTCNEWLPHSVEAEFHDAELSLREDGLHISPTPHQVHL